MTSKDSENRIFVLRSVLRIPKEISVWFGGAFARAFFDHRGGQDMMPKVIFGRSLTGFLRVLQLPEDGRRFSAVKNNSIVCCTPIFDFRSKTNEWLSAAMDRSPTAKACSVTSAQARGCGGDYDGANFLTFFCALHDFFPFRPPSKVDYWICDH